MDPNVIFNEHSWNWKGYSNLWHYDIKYLHYCYWNTNALKISLQYSDDFNGKLDFHTEEAFDDDVLYALFQIELVNFSKILWDLHNF
jgi:hypothetical protein